ncbi:hypothetical protein [Roseimaritima sediminicola]|uniref:hypothetical protein n=1 Tax=Roseimaritima sediminicola TaxID=2662066 RepID=UPI0012984057|nr:hypothetical protein [Roseimaritima sediminicola]
MRMSFRIVCLSLVALSVHCGVAAGQQPNPAPAGSGFYTDPATGNVYRRVQRTIEKPVSEVRTQVRERTIYKPQVVTQVQSQQRTVYSPTVQYELEPRLYNRWNPFVPASLGYAYVPRTRWQARSETIQQPVTSTQWVAEKQTDTVPTQVTRMARESVVQYELVQGSAAPTADNTVIARLQPYQPSTQIAAAAPAPTIPASAVVGGIASLASDPPNRSTTQTGMQPSVLQPSVLPPPVVASTPIMTWLR